MFIEIFAYASSILAVAWRCLASYGPVYLAMFSVLALFLTGRALVSLNVMRREKFLAATLIVMALQIALLTFVNLGGGFDGYWIALALGILGATKIVRSMRAQDK